MTTKSGMSMSRGRFYTEKHTHTRGVPSKLHVLLRYSKHKHWKCSLKYLVFQFIEPLYFKHIEMYSVDYKGRNEKEVRGFPLKSLLEIEQKQFFIHVHKNLCLILCLQIYIFFMFYLNLFFYILYNLTNSNGL